MELTRSLVTVFGLVALICALGLLAVPTVATVPAGEGGFVLPDGGEEHTEYLTVPVGMAVVYETHSDSFVTYWGEVQGPRTVAGGDGAGMEGCLVSTEPFAFRMRWSNRDVLPMPEASVTYALRVVPDPGGCQDVEEQIRAHDVDNAAPPGFTRVIVAVVFAFVVKAALVVGAFLAIWWRKRPADGRTKSRVQRAAAPPR